MKMLGYVGSCLLFRVTMLLGDLNVCFFSLLLFLSAMDGMTLLVH
jgi:hypothetical protein